MINFPDSGKKLLVPYFLCPRFAWLYHSFSSSVLSILQTFLYHVNQFWIEFGYFITLSSLGFLALKASKPRTAGSSFKPKDLDFFFTSVSASTVSSMSTIEMEVFSNTQLIFLTILMFVGGEVFTSMLGLHLMRAKIKNQKTNIANSKIDSHSTQSQYSNTDHIELGIIPDHDFGEEKTDTKEEEEGNLKLKSIKSLAYLVCCYLLVIHVVGSTLISIYLSLIPSAKKVLKTKGLNMETFSIFTTVSTFSNCGFVPTNENMIVFKKNSGLLLILISQILMGNTLYPVCLRLSIWFMDKFTKRSEFRYILKNSRELEYGHLLSGRHCFYLVNTALGFIILQLAIFCILEWNAEAIGGLNAYQKLVGSLFQVVNSRHTGESIFDLSAISQAMLVLFVLMMYLPPYTSYLPVVEEDENIWPRENGKNTKKKRSFGELLLLSQLTYLVIFVILICITERHHMKRDPLNFNVLHVVIEVISAYGNVGFSAGYSCERQIHPDGQCKDAWYGFVGKWSDEGKFVLIVVMFFGRLKKFSMRGGKFWSLA